MKEVGWIPYLGYNPWAETQASSSGEGIAGVSTSLDLEREAPDLVVGVGEGGDSGEVVRADGSAAEHDGRRLGLVGSGGGHGRWAAVSTGRRRRRGGDWNWSDVQHQHHFLLRRLTSSESTSFLETIKQVNSMWRSMMSGPGVNHLP